MTQISEATACSRKASYPSRSRAQSAVSAMRRKIGNGAESRAMSAYKCRFCHSWHIGKNSRKMKKGKNLPLNGKISS